MFNKIWSKLKCLSGCHDWAITHYSESGRPRIKCYHCGKDLIW